MASVIRGDDNFDSSSVGPSTTAGAVGTYLFAVDYTGAFHTVGATVAGSTLATWEVYSTANRVAGVTTFTTAGTSRAYSVSGTWQWMSGGLLTGSRSRMGLAVRIS